MKIIIIGAGEVGYNIANRLSAEHKRVTVIDKNESAARHLSESLDVQAINASGSNPKVLIEAGIREADILLAVTDSDEVNITTCLLADFIAPGIKKLARVRSAALDPYHQRFKEDSPKIDTIINPETEVVGTIKRLMNVPGAIDVGDFVEGRVTYAGIRLNPKSGLVGVKLMDFSSGLGKDHPLIAAIVRNNEVIVPRGKTRFAEGDLVYFVCEQEALEKNLKLFGITPHPVKNALVIGGGRIGERLARQLSKKGVKTKIIESNLERCHALSTKVGDSVVLHGDGSDQNVLLEEDIHLSDVVISVTNDDETNILVSLLAKNLGVRDTITRIGKTNYLPLLPVIGIDKVVSPRLSAISSILQSVRKGKVLSDISIFEERGEFIEAVALEASGITATPLKNVPFPRGVLLVCVIRNGQVVIPMGDTQVNPGDRIILFAAKQAVKKVEKLLSVELGTA